MIAGLTTLNLLKEDKDLFQRLDGKTERLHQGMKTLIEARIPHQFNRLGSMLSLHFTKKPVVDSNSRFRE